MDDCIVFKSIDSWLLTDFIVRKRNFERIIMYIDTDKNSSIKATNITNVFQNDQSYDMLYV